MSEIKIDENIKHIYANHNNEIIDLKIVNAQDVEHPVWVKPLDYSISIIPSDTKLISTDDIDVSIYKVGYIDMHKGIYTVNKYNQSNSDDQLRFFDFVLLKITSTNKYLLSNYYALNIYGGITSNSYIKTNMAKINTINSALFLNSTAHLLTYLPNINALHNTITSPTLNTKCYNNNNIMQSKLIMYNDLNISIKIPENTGSIYSAKSVIQELNDSTASTDGFEIQYRNVLFDSKTKFNTNILDCNSIQSGVTSGNACYSLEDGSTILFSIYTFNVTKYYNITFNGTTLTIADSETNIVLETISIHITDTSKKYAHCFLINRVNNMIPLRSERITSYANICFFISNTETYSNALYEVYFNGINCKFIDCNNNKVNTILYDLSNRDNITIQDNTITVDGSLYTCVPFDEDDFNNYDISEYNNEKYTFDRIEIGKYSINGYYNVTYLDNSESTDSGSVQYKKYYVNLYCINDYFDLNVNNTDIDTYTSIYNATYYQYYIKSYNKLPTINKISNVVTCDDDKYTIKLNNNSYLNNFLSIKSIDVEYQNNNINLVPKLQQDKYMITWYLDNVAYSDQLTFPNACTNFDYVYDTNNNCIGVKIDGITYGTSVNTSEWLTDDNTSVIIYPTDGHYFIDNTIVNVSFCKSYFLKECIDFYTYICIDIRAYNYNPITITCYGFTINEYGNTFIPDIDFDDAANYINNIAFNSNSITIGDNIYYVTYDNDCGYAYTHKIITADKYLNGILRKLYIIELRALTANNATSDTIVSDKLIPLTKTETYTYVFADTDIYGFTINNNGDYINNTTVTTTSRPIQDDYYIKINNKYYYPKSKNDNFETGKVIIVFDDETQVYNVTAAVAEIAYTTITVNFESENTDVQWLDSSDNTVESAEYRVRSDEITEGITIYRYAIMLPCGEYTLASSAFDGNYYYRIRYTINSQTHICTVYYDTMKIGITKAVRFNVLCTYNAKKIYFIDSKTNNNIEYTGYIIPNSYNVTGAIGTSEISGNDYYEVTVTPVTLDNDIVFENTNTVKEERKYVLACDDTVYIANTSTGNSSTIHTVTLSQHHVRFYTSLYGDWQNSIGAVVSANYAKGTVISANGNTVTVGDDTYTFVLNSKYADYTDNVLVSCSNSTVFKEVNIDVSLTSCILYRATAGATVRLTGIGVNTSYSNTVLSANTQYEIIYGKEYTLSITGSSKYIESITDSNSNSTITMGSSLSNITYNGNSVSNTATITFIADENSHIITINNTAGKYVYIPYNSSVRYSSYYVNGNKHSAVTSNIYHYFSNSLTIKNLYIYSSLIQTTATTNYGFYFKDSSGDLNIATTNNSSSTILSPSGEAAKNIFNSNDKLITSYSGCGTPTLYTLPLAINMTAYSHIIVNNTYTASANLTVTITDVATMLLSTPVQIDISNNGTKLLTTAGTANNHYVLLHCKLNNYGTISLSFTPTTNVIVSPNTATYSNFGDMSNYKTLALTKYNCCYIWENNSTHPAGTATASIDSGTSSTITSGSLYELSAGSVLTLTITNVTSETVTALQNTSGTNISYTCDETTNREVLDGAYRYTLKVSITAVAGIIYKISTSGYTGTIHTLTISSNAYFGNIYGGSSTFNAYYARNNNSVDTTSNTLKFSDSVKITGAYFAKFGNNSNISNKASVMYYLYKGTDSGSIHVTNTVSKQYGADDYLIYGYSNFTPTSVQQLVMSVSNYSKSYAKLELNGVTFTSNTTINISIADSKTLVVTSGASLDYYYNNSKIYTLTANTYYVMQRQYSSTYNTLHSGVFVTNDTSKAVYTNILNYNSYGDSRAAPKDTAIARISDYGGSGYTYTIASATCKMYDVIMEYGLYRILKIQYTSGNSTYDVVWYGYVDDSDGDTTASNTNGKYWNGIAWTSVPGTATVTVYYAGGISSSKTYGIYVGTVSSVTTRYIPICDSYNNNRTYYSVAYDNTTSSCYNITTYYRTATGTTVGTSATSAYTVSLSQSGPYKYIHRHTMSVSSAANLQVKISIFKPEQIDNYYEQCYYVMMNGSNAYYWNGSQFVAMSSTDTVIVYTI